MDDNPNSNQSEKRCLLEEKQSSSMFSILSEATFVMAISVALYILSYCYEAGFLAYYGIPNSFARVDFLTILAFFFHLLLYSIIAYVYLAIPLLILYKCISNASVNEYFSKTLNWLSVLIYPSIIICASLWVNSSYYVIVVAFALITLMILGYKEYNNHGYAITFITNTLNSTARAIGGYLWFILLITTFVGAPLSYFVGKVNASDRTEYLVFAKNPSYAVIRNYNDITIAMPFDKDSKIFDSKIIIKKMDSKEFIFIMNPQVGPLTSISQQELFSLPAF